MHDMTTAPPPPPQDLIYYPAFCHPVSPTFNIWAKLTAVDVHNLDERAGYEGQHIYFHLNHPIRYVRLVGVLVAYDDYDRRCIMILDDSSGATIEVICPKPAAEGGGGQHAQGDKKKNAGPPPPVPMHAVTAPEVPDLAAAGITLGSIVKVKGGIGLFRGSRQILLKRISVIRDTNEEVRCWSELAAFRADVLSKPWLVEKRVQRSLLRRARGEKVNGKENRHGREAGAAREGAKKREKEARGRRGLDDGGRGGGEKKAATADPDVQIYQGHHPHHHHHHHRHHHYPDNNGSTSNLSHKPADIGPPTYRPPSNGEVRRGLQKTSSVRKSTAGAQDDQTVDHSTRQKPRPIPSRET
ncbi:MAG: hypothetical protein M1826_000546 [Phylliscum demangeonii]|nr:MAG: hypothetical protein M1826_000546 [Phylliscum demangeonii]